MYLTDKAVSVRWLIFFILAFFSMTACDETNTVAIDFIQESAIEIDTVLINQIDFRSIEIVNDSHGVPVVRMNETVKIKNHQLSISHEKKYAVAFALLTL